MSEPPTSPGDIAREVRRLADLLFPGQVVWAQLHIRHPDGSTSVVNGPCVITAPLSDRQKEIMQVFEEAGEGAVLTGPAIAKLVGCDYDGTLRGDLSALKKTGRLKAHNPGYSLPE